MTKKDDKIARLRTLAARAKQYRARHPRNSPRWQRCQYRVYGCSAAIARAEKGVGT